jgi:diguanylate cyclase (GGDEF)-like protein
MNSDLKNAQCGIVPQSNMASFLLQCDEKLHIHNIFWCHPVTIISPYQKNLQDIFKAADAQKIKQKIKQAHTQKEVFTCKEYYKILSPDCAFSLCLISMGDKVLIHGMDAAILEVDACASAIKETVQRFLRVVKVYDTDVFTDNESIIREQFEKIQKLNNDLVNTQRQLKKINATLNRLNEDLNNRLVKDALTGLVSRYQFRQEIELAIYKAPDKLGIFAFIDLDDFKRINDTYGHAAGDTYLKTFASRFAQLPFAEFIGIRIAGDEFGLYVHGYQTVTEEDIKSMWNAIAEQLIKDPIDLGDAIEEISCSAGMAVYNRDTKNVFELIELADFAMYQAKRTGKNAYRAFDRLDYENNRYLLP